MIFVPLAVPAALASRHNPDWTPVMLPLALRVHCWLVPPLQSQMATAVPLVVQTTRQNGCGRRMSSTPR